LAVAFGNEIRVQLLLRFPGWSLEGGAEISSFAESPASFFRYEPTPIQWPGKLACDPKRFLRNEKMPSTQ
jgi:hypothetical protein